MNLFLVGLGGDAAAGERALRSLLERLPFFPGRPVATWSHGRASAAWVTHGADQTGGLEYAGVEPRRLALFAGRPIRWTHEREAVGHDPRDLAAHASGDELDGRFAIVRLGEGMEVVTDPLGAYPVYEAEVRGARWVSNNGELLREVVGARSLAPSVIASVVGGGWSLGGDPVWAGVHRVAAGPSAAEVARLLGAGFDPDRAAALLVAATRALADWPGRPSVVPVTAGRDSRLVLAAAMRAGIPFEATTGGEPGATDVAIGRRLADAAGVAHSLVPDDPHGSPWTDWRRAAEVLALSQAGTATLADAAGFPLGPRDGPLPLWHSGQGGEIARAYYGSDEGTDRKAITDRLARRFLGTRPGRSDVLSDDGREIVRRQIDDWVGEQLDAGIAPADVPDAFYLERRMGTWAGPTHGAVEYVRDTTSPLWSARLLPDLLGLPAGERQRQEFHRQVLDRLAPELAAIPYERPPGLARKAVAEARRRLSPRRADPFDPILREIRDVVLQQRGHDAWAVLDRARVEALLTTDAASLDTMSRYYAWRLATVFGGFPEPS